MTPLIVFKKNKGATLVIVAGIIFILLLAGAGLLYFSSYTLIKHELQSLADSSAYAGAASLAPLDNQQNSCVITTTAGSVNSCYNRALLTAVNTITNQTVKTGLLSRETVTAPSPGDTEWDSGSFHIKIERGIWFNREQGFVSFEESQPFPNSLAFANAVKVTVSINKVISAFEALFSGEAGITVSAVAVARKVGNVPVAPFAIPLCALFKTSQGGGQATLDLQQSCTHDIYFTNTNRYCTNPLASDCSVLPQFDWDPAEPAPQWPWPITDNRGNDNACFWATPPSPDGDPWDSYGYVGLPAPAQGSGGTQVIPDVTEPIIINVIQQRGPNSLPTAGLGDNFYPLPSGLVQPSSNLPVWRRIINDNGIADEDGGYPQMIYTSLGGRNLNNNWAFSRRESRNRMCTNDNPSDTPTKPPRPYLPGFGTCNSMRTGWGFWDQFTTINNSCQYVPPGFPTPSPTFENAPVWQVKVPVVNNLTTTTDCSQPNTPFVYNPGDTLQIVGFVVVDIFDVDIGNPPPSPPVSNFCLIRARTYHDPDNTYPFGFTKGNCNLVRARIDCSTNLITTAEPAATLPPLLVE
ncbi:MAG: hypothetical protein D6780_01720 [Candidatus Dadabacteria bacterium]|nr:MAG: hypothetical protein D6780_01720 [Candidatus Dadabacteria bacterium]